MARVSATLLGAAAAGVLIWVATQFDRGTNIGYWAVLGILAGAGAVLALARGIGPIRGITMLVGRLVMFLPVLVAAGWVLIAGQPDPNWFSRHVAEWSTDIGIGSLVADLERFVGVLAFGLGVVFALMAGMGRAPAPVEGVAPATDREPAPAEPAVTEERQRHRVQVG